MALEDLSLEDSDKGSKGGGLSSLRELAYSGMLPGMSLDFLPKEVSDPAAKWESFAAGMLKPTASGQYGEAVSNAFGALAEGRNREAELRAKYLPLVASALLQRQMQAAQIAQMQWKLAQDFDQSGVAALTPLLAKEGDITGADVTRALSAAVDRGLIPRESALRLYSSLPTTGDSKTLRDAINRLSIGKLNAEQARGAVTPKIETQDLGGVRQPVAVPPGQPGQSGPVGNALQKSLTPGERLGAVGTEKDQAGNLTFFDRLTGTQSYPNNKAPLGVQGGSGGPGSGRALEAPPRETVGSVKFKQEEGQRGSKYAGEMEDSLEAMRQVQLRISEMRNYVKNFPTGATAEARIQLGRWLKDMAGTLGLSPQQSEQIASSVAKGSIADAQAFQKMAVQGTLDILKAANPRFTQAEFGVISQNNPNITLDPQALDKMLNFITKQYQYKSAEQREFASFMKENGDFTQWNPLWNKMSQDLGFVAPAFEKGSARNSVVSRERTPIGTSNSGRKMRLNKDGLWEYDDGR